MSRELIKRNDAETFSFISLLKGCTYKKDICGEFAKPKQVLEELPIRDVVSWSTLIGGMSERGKLMKHCTVLKRCNVRAYP